MGIFWRSKRQPVTSKGSPSAEIYASSDAVKSARLLAFRLSEMSIDVPRPLIIRVDASVTVSFQQNTCVNSTLRGTVGLHHAWVCELRDQEMVQFMKVDTENNHANIGTKCLSTKEFRKGAHMLQAAST